MARPGWLAMQVRRRACHLPRAAGAAFTTRRHLPITDCP